MEEILKYNQKRQDEDEKLAKKVESKNKLMEKTGAGNNSKPLASSAAMVDMLKMDKLFQLTHNIPKIELHAHIGGCFRPKTFVDLAEAKKIDIDHIDFYKVDIKTAFEIFKVGGQLITDT